MRSSRRTFVGGLGAGAAIVGLGGLAPLSSLKATSFKTNPFTLGVASGEPSPDGFVIWTRLAPRPFDDNGGVDGPHGVMFEVASNPTFQTVLRRGQVTTQASGAHSVHVEISGLAAERDYYYRFFAGGAVSPVGRARTLPALGRAIEQLRFGVVGCQRWEDGFYTAYRHVSEEAFDFVFHYGDFIYERRRNKGKKRRPIVRRLPVDFKEARALDEYRQLYAAYCMDQDLRMARGACPWIMSTDDHEVVNDYAGDVDRKYETSRRSFLKRRAAAYQAYFEHMPLRQLARPRGPDMRLYRRFVLGDLLQIDVLDTRQYRSPQPCGDYGEYKRAEPCRARHNTTILGPEQDKWLLAGLGAHKTHWNIIAQQVPMMQRRKSRSGEISYNMDKWDGYPRSRQRILDQIDGRNIKNFVVLAGDVHANFAGDLMADFDRDGSKVLGAEFVGTSISSGGNGRATTKGGRRMLRANRHIKFHNKQRGYMRCIVTKDRCHVDFRVLPVVTRREAPVTTKASFVVEAGAAGVKAV